MKLPSGIIFPSDLPLLKLGSRGTDVIILQAALLINGYDLDVDGIFGIETETYLRDFQTAKGLSSDGICGPDTWGAL